MRVNKMNLIGIFAVLLASFGTIGLVAAISDREKVDSDRDSNVVISQEVPSVFDAFQNDGDGK